MGEDFITTGDRVVVVGNVHPYRGEHGEVIYEDGWGKCTVRLDTGRVISARNAVVLQRTRAGSAALSSERPRDLAA